MIEVTTVAAALRRCTTRMGRYSGVDAAEEIRATYAEIDRLRAIENEVIAYRAHVMDCVTDKPF